jgi:hypothetical protein
MLSNERIKFYLSSEEIQHLKLKSSDKSSEADGIDVNEMVVLAASLDDCQELEPGDIIWAKLTGTNPSFLHVRVYQFIFSICL